MFNDETKSDKMQKRLYKVFEAQDYENEYFDVIFHVDGRELYAHGTILVASSNVFKEQLLQNRSTPNQPIQIDEYSYDEFFEFLRLIYLHFLHITHYYYSDYRRIGKLFVTYKLANLYQSNAVIEFCNESFRHIDNDNDLEALFQNIGLPNKHPLRKGYITLDYIVVQQFPRLIKYNRFIELDKSVVKAFVNCNGLTRCYLQSLYSAIIKWAEYQAMITVEMPEKEKNELMLHYIKDFLPCFSHKFLLYIVVPEGLITVKEANEYKNIEVTIKSGKKSIIGTFVDSYGIFEYINYNENEEEIEIYDDGRRVIWYENFGIPSTPSTVEKMKGCNWYLLFGKNGKLNIKHRNLIKNDDYLIAEMKEMDDEFIFDNAADFHATVTRNN